jgi:RNA polymerase sigma-70 factor (ECF subfamily)
VGSDLESSSPDDPREEFNDFFRRDYSSLLAFLIKQGANVHEAEDAAQEAIIQVYSRWETIDTPRAYARRTAENAYLRSAARAAEEPRRAALGGWAVNEPPIVPLDRVVLGEQQTELIVLLQLLPPAQRRVMAWHLDGFTNAEIAEHLQVKPGNVASNLYQAKKTLRALWEERRQRAATIGRRPDDERSGR